MSSITLRNIESQEISISHSIATLSKGVRVALVAIATFSVKILELLDNNLCYYGACLDALYLRCMTRVDKIAVGIINHGREKALDSEVRAFEEGVKLNLAAILSLKRLGLDETTSVLDPSKLADIKSDTDAIAAHIAQNKEFVPLNGFCLGYAWLFAAFLLKHKDHLTDPAETLKAFVAYEHIDKTLLLSFLGNFNYTEMIEVPDVATVRILNDAELEKMNAALPMPKNRIALWQKVGGKMIGNWIRKHMDASFKADALKNKTSIEPLTVRPQSIREDLINAYSESDGCPLVITTRDHAMTVYASKKENHYLFFDPSFGIQSYRSFEDFVSGVECHIKHLGSSKVLFSIHKISSSEETV